MEDGLFRKGGPFLMLKVFYIAVNLTAGSG